MKTTRKKNILLLILLLLCVVPSYGQYWNWDFSLPRLKGIKKIQVTIKRWDYPQYKKAPTKSKSILYLNNDGLVVREDEYGPNIWLDTRNIYEYIGKDTQMTYIRIFTYASSNGGYAANQRPSKGSRLRNVVEFVNEHSPLRREWRFYQLPDSAQKNLLNITSSEFDSTGRKISSHYYSYESAGYTDSTAYQYKGDTIIATTYSVQHVPKDGTNDHHVRRQYEPIVPQIKYQEVNIERKDSAGRTIYSERVSGPYSHMGNRTTFFYDKRGRYLGFNYMRDCDNCKGKWETGGERYKYDLKSRVKSVESFHQGNKVLRYDLAYFE